MDGAKWLADIAAELEKLTPEEIAAAEPQEVIEPNMTVVGPAPEESRRLITLYKRFRQSILDISQYVNLSTDEARQQELYYECIRLEKSCDIVRSMILLDCQLTYRELHFRPMVSVRKGWLVVSRDIQQLLQAQSPPPQEPPKSNPSKKYH